MKKSKIKIDVEKQKFNMAMIVSTLKSLDITEGLIIREEIGLKIPKMTIITIRRITQKCKIFINFQRLIEKVFKRKFSDYWYILIASFEPQKNEGFDLYYSLKQDEILIKEIASKIEATLSIPISVIYDLRDLIIPH